MWPHIEAISGFRGPGQGGSGAAASSATHDIETIEGFSTGQAIYVDFRQAGAHKPPRRKHSQGTLRERPFRVLAITMAAAAPGECPEWQRELTVNQPPHGFAGSSPASPTIRISARTESQLDAAAQRRLHDFALFQNALKDCEDFAAMIAALQTGLRHCIGRPTRV